MGGVVGLGNVNIGIDSNVDKRILGIGQWGTNLYVSTQVAEDVCQIGRAYLRKWQKLSL